jgi:rSAM/selenodomain-associated transferase 1
MSKKNKNALILMTKAPRVGTVKTRLQPELTPGQSLLLYQAMVEDTVRQFNDVGFCDLKIFFYPADANGEMKTWLGDQFEYIPQHGDDLGEKMHNAIAEILKQKYQKVVLVGSDIPTLDSTTIVRAFSSLDDYDVVLGPCKDGGYYLIGMKQQHPELFEGVVWSTNLVLQQTIQIARSAELEIVQLEKKSDIDTYVEVEELWSFLKKRNMKGTFSFKSKTYDMLKTFFESQEEKWNN